MKRITILFSLLIFSFVMCACSNFGADDNNKRATCNRLKSNIIFSGATSNTREANIQKAEKPLQEHDFDKNNCAG
jgi:hypothetical protein